MSTARRLFRAVFTVGLAVLAWAQGYQYAAGVNSGGLTYALIALTVFAAGMALEE